MTDSCRKLHCQLEKGWFGESFTDLSDDLNQHLKTCKECRQLIESLMSIEEEIAKLPSIEIEPERLQRMKVKVWQSIEAKQKNMGWFASLFRPIPTIGASMIVVTAIAVMLFLIQPNSTRKFHKDDLISEALTLSEEVLIANEELPEVIDDPIVAALIFSNRDMESDPGILNSSYFDPMPDWLYPQEAIVDIEQMTDLELTELRRYLS